MVCLELCAGKSMAELLAEKEAKKTQEKEMLAAQMGMRTTPMVLSEDILDDFFQAAYLIQTLPHCVDSQMVG